MYSPGSQLGNRIIGGFVALVCLWLSAGAVLAHTDDLSALRTFSTSAQPAMNHAVAPSAPEQCAACEWTQSTGSLQTPTLSVDTFPLTRMEQPLFVPGALHLLPFTHTLLRGPPVS